MERKKIDISKVFANEGQIDGLPSNPRTIRKEKFDKLMKSIRDLPEMTEARDLLVYPHDGKFVVLGGNISIIHKKERSIRTCFPLSILLSAHLSVLVRFPIPMNVLAIC